MSEWKYSELPPLARGRGKDAGKRWLSIGITPARAGKRFQTTLVEVQNGNYPRSRGEERKLVFGRLVRPELPPLARGREDKQSPYRTSIGITPARAGKSEWREYMGAHPRNYPRSRGEESNQ